MKTTEAWSRGIYPLLHSWNDEEQIVRNRDKWRAAVGYLGERWAFIQAQERKLPLEASKPEPKPVGHAVIDMQRKRP